MDLKPFIIFIYCLGTLSVSGQYLSERDLSFGDAGQVILDVDALDHLTAVATDSVGNTWFCGRTGTVTNGIEYDYVAGKLKPDGTLDSSFANQGILRGDFEAYTSSEFVDIALLSDGIALLGNGYHYSGTDSQSVYVMKVGFDGQLDVSFGNGGLYEGRYRGLLNEGTKIAALDNDRVLMVGATYDSAYSHKETGFIGRLLANGQPDSTFGGSGILTWDGLNGLQSAMILETANNRHSDGTMFLDIAIAPWGDYFVVGYYDTGLETKNLVARFHPDGTLVPNFVNGGIFIFDVAPGQNQQTIACSMIGDQLAMGLFITNEDRFAMQTIDSTGLLGFPIYQELVGTVSRLHDLYAEDSVLYFCGEAREIANSSPGYTSDYFTLGAMTPDMEMVDTFGAAGFLTDHFGTADEAGSHAMAGGQHGLILGGQLNADFSTGNFEDFGFIRLKRKSVSTVSIEDFNAGHASVTAYPNPTTSFLTVESNTSILTVEILNMQGQVMQTLSGNHQSTRKVDLSDLSNGTYLLRILSDQGSQVQKIVKQ